MGIQMYITVIGTHNILLLTNQIILHVIHMQYIIMNIPDTI